MLRIISFFAIFLSVSFAQISTGNQTLRVLENETRFDLKGNDAAVLLVVENPSNEFDARVKIEIVAPNDFVHGRAEITQKIGSGKNILTLPVVLEQAILNDNALLWYRLRYEITAENANTSGIVSLSQILPEVFELKTVTNYAIAEKSYRVRVQSVNLATQNGVADVELEGEIEIENLAEKPKAQSKTDAEGFAFLEFNLPDFKMNADLEIKIVGKKNGLTREIAEEIEGAGMKYAEIATDKPLYQPNQTVNLRLYSYNFDDLPTKNSELTIEIEGESDEEIVFKETVKTSRFGIASAAWKIPEGAKLGNYRIYVRNAENDEIGGERFKITRYDLPNFYVEARTDRKFYLPDQTTAKVEINAKYLFGKNLSEAKVRIVSQKDEDFAEIGGATDAEGKFSAEIDISKAFDDFKPNYQRFEDLTFTAYVTDLTTNRTEPRKFDIRITNNPIHVYLIGETYRRSSLLPIKYFVSTFYADGTPASCDVAVYEFIEKDEKSEGEIGKTLAKFKTNSYGAGKLILPAQSSEDDLNFKIEAMDAKGLTGSFDKKIYLNDDAVIQVETDKIAYRKGESVKVSITSSKPKGLVFVDVVQRLQPLFATQVQLENGRAELILPYQEDFKNSLNIVAYFEDDDEDVVIGGKSIIFPTPTNLEIDARTKKEIYRPGEDVSVKFRVQNADKSFAENALGVLVIDKAIEERARTESETSDENSFLNRTFASRMAGFFGQGKVFGDVTVRDIKNLDLRKPLSADFALALEIALGEFNYRPQIERSVSFRDHLDKVFTPFFREKMKPVGIALDKVFTEKTIYPTDEKSLHEILRMEKIEFDALEDAWGNNFRTEFRVKRDVLQMEIWSNGADKLPNTADDLTVFQNERKYFQRIGFAIDKAMREYTERTNGFIVDYKILRDELLKQNINLDILRDAWGNLYQFEFTVDRTNYLLHVKSKGADGKTDVLGVYLSDDFTLWTNRADYFTVTRANFIKSFNEYVEKNKTFPRNEAEMREILKAIGFNLDETKDIYGRPFYIEQKQTSKLANIYSYQNSNLKAVKQKIISFSIKSAGNDGIKANFDDFEMTSFTGATSEEIGVLSLNPFSGKKIIRQKTAATPNGAIGGTVFDPAGAVIPNANVKVTSILRRIIREAKSNESGEFFIDNLPKDIYKIEVYAPGFNTTSIINLSIEANIFIEVDVILEIGAFSSIVEVTANSDASIDTSSSKIETTITVNRSLPYKAENAPSFTPRLRDYFAETLVWMPEIVTNEKGEASINFKMADSLTTWKLYVIGSNEKGEFGVVEKELQTFQPFFAELEPPRILTEGDEIALSVPIRNYTDKRQKVLVSMAENDWSRIIRGASQNIEVAANATQNAIFNFQAIAPVTDGKQKVTAQANKEGDAIEKPITVRPDGREIVETKSGLFQKETSFEVNFPANSFPKNRKTEVKIYPNMLAHVAESVEGLLSRPYGCGEQTTSSTYPNLMILKIEKDLGKPIDAKLRTKARIYLEEGYKRLLNYQTDTGFGYWNGNSPDVALTAYVLRFLHDAEDFIEVDDDVIEKTEKWLLSQQNTDGNWSLSGRNSHVSTAYVLRSLSLTAGNDAGKKRALQSGIEFLKTRFAEINDAFVLANLALVSHEIGDTETEVKAIEKLEKLGQTDKQFSQFWTTPNTPFYGWGQTASIETTALAVQAFLKYKPQQPDLRFQVYISRGLNFLLRNKDRYGVWYSTQTTVNVLDTLILLQKNSENANSEKAEIYINGAKVQEFSIAADALSKPLFFDASTFLSENNRIEIKGLSGQTMAQIVSKYYINWSNAPTDSAYFDFQVDFDKLQANISEEITGNVKIQRKISRYGMILAEIGLPPGADVVRTSLEKAKADEKISNYDILPDKIVIYAWADSKLLEFNFKFRPRFGLNAQTAPSLVYDYYNEEAKATIVPARFVVK